MTATTDSKATLLKRKTNQFDEEDAPLSVLSCKFNPFWLPPHPAAQRSLLGTAGVSAADTTSFLPLSPLLSFGVSHLSGVKCTGKAQPSWGKAAVVSEGTLGYDPWLYQVIYCDTLIGGRGGGCPWYLCTVPLLKVCSQLTQHEYGSGAF